MLNTKKALYILPDVAYIADLLPTKKGHDFTIQNFRQINGNFFDNKAAVTNNLNKLLSKVDPEEYALVLPDFLFTNTIVTVEETAEAKVKQHINDKLLPSLKISSKTHEIVTFVLTTLKGSAKVQLSAIDKKTLAPIATALEKTQIKVKQFVPLSWTLKSVVSLEPSITVTQLGSQLYLAQHYIGVDQTQNTPTEESEKIIEAVKTIKGSEPSTQTMYLLTNALVEQQLKENLNETLPLQQLADTTQEGDIPSAVSKCIEAGMKTLSIEDFSLPQFKMPSADSLPSVKEDQLTTPQEEDTPAEAPATSDIPTPSPPPSAAEEETEAEEEKKDEAIEAGKAEETTEKTTEETTTETEEIAEDKPAEDQDTPPTEPESEIKEEKEEEKEEATKAVEAEEEKTEETVKTTDASAPAINVTPVAVGGLQTEETPSSKTDSTTEPTESQAEETKETAMPSIDTPATDSSSALATETPTQQVDLSQFAQKQSGEDGEKKVIKNKNGVNMKVVFITLAVFFATVGIGLGLGKFVLNLSNKPSEEVANGPLVEETPTPEEEAPASPTPEPEPELNREDLKILVVNATKIAGHAGKTKKALEDAGFGSVSAGNAEGEYDAGIYVLIKEENKALETLLEEDASLELEYKEDVDTEDPKGAYDAVVVLAE